MKYNLASELPHPNIIILDSPLITFKDKDLNKEQVNEEVKKKFYEYLAEEFKEQQIIILENAEPHEEVKDKINYYHFSKNNEYGRYGFFPIKNNL
ncbi:hypothetical protein [uncultured Clostridium sp.]|uniref:hypothetical protein n=1 Tax=uncultured Clostridium sp. TaxID=59620 RepID=UPI0025D2C1DA|nr:hypothetical protein [uncultured Clostridium sp.]